jgi:uncharacterized phage-associated protein
MHMTYDARQVANWFVARAQREGRPLSIMSLLKLTYIAHGWHLETQNAPLFGNRIEAWQYGPVIPDVYSDFRRQGVAVTGTVNTVPQCQFDPIDERLLDQVWSIYGKLPAFRLSDLTHVAGGPWDVASKMGGHYARIPDELIHGHYVELRKRAATAENA